jgi:hypothetical protein
MLKNQTNFSGDGESVETLFTRTRIRRHHREASEELRRSSGADLAIRRGTPLIRIHLGVPLAAASYFKKVKKHRIRTIRMAIWDIVK